MHRYIAKTCGRVSESCEGVYATCYAYIEGKQCSQSCMPSSHAHPLPSHNDRKDPAMPL